MENEIKGQRIYNKFITSLQKELTSYALYKCNYNTLYAEQAVIDTIDYFHRYTEIDGKYYSNLSENGIIKEIEITNEELMKKSRIYFNPNEFCYIHLTTNLERNYKTDYELIKLFKIKLNNTIIDIFRSKQIYKLYDSTNRLVKLPSDDELQDYGGLTRHQKLHNYAIINNYALTNYLKINSVSLSAPINEDNTLCDIIIHDEIDNRPIFVKIYKVLNWLVYSGRYSPIKKNPPIANRISEIKMFIEMRIERYSINDIYYMNLDYFENNFITNETSSIRGLINKITTKIQLFIKLYEKESTIFNKRDYLDIGKIDLNSDTIQFKPFWLKTYNEYKS